MNYVLQELRRQQAVLARLMLGNPSREETAPPETASPQEWMRHEGSAAPQPTPLGSGMQASVPWSAGRSGEQSPLSLQQLVHESGPLGAGWTEAAPSRGPSMAAARQAAEMAGQAAEDAGRTSRGEEPAQRPTAQLPADEAMRQAIYELGAAWADGRTRNAADQTAVGGETAASSWQTMWQGNRDVRRRPVQPEPVPTPSGSGTGGSGVSTQLVTELMIESPVYARPTAPAAMSLAFERDARRYDGGFELY